MASSRTDDFAGLRLRVPRVGSYRLAWLAQWLCLCTVGPVAAGGLSIPTYCVECQGSGNAAAPARADSPATVFANPAGIARLTGTRAELGLHAARIDVQLDRGSASGPLGAPVAGSLTSDAGALVWPLNLYLTHSGGGPWSLGLGLTTPFGLTTDYDRGWVGRYHALRSELKTLDLGLALAYRLSDRVSLGAGIDLVYARAELSHAVDLGSLLTARLGRPVPGLGITPGNPAIDGYTRLEGDDWGLGWALGLLLEPVDGTRIGLSYRSKVDLDLEGSTLTRVPELVAEVTAGQVATSNRDASSRLTLPATLRLGLWQSLGSDWRLLLGAQWTGWHSFDGTRVRFADGGPDLTEPHDWNDVWRYSLGLEYRYSDRLTLRGGLEYDESPLPRVNRSLRVVGRDQRWISLGLSFRATRSLTWDLAYSHVATDDYRVDLGEVTTPWASGGRLPGNRLTGEVSSSADILGLGLRLAY